MDADRVAAWIVKWWWPLLIVSMGLTIFPVAFNPDLPTFPLPKPHYEITSSLPTDVISKLKNAPRGYTGLSYGGQGYEEGFHWASYYDKSNGIYIYYLQLSNIGKRPFWVRWGPVYRMTGRSIRLGVGETKYVVIRSSAMPVLSGMEETNITLFGGGFDFGPIRLRWHKLMGSGDAAYIPRLPKINIPRR